MYSYSFTLNTTAVFTCDTNTFFGCFVYKKMYAVSLNQYYIAKIIK